MFKFNFANEPEEDNKEDSSTEGLLSDPTWLKSEAVLPSNETDVIRDIFRNCEEHTLDCKNVSLKYFSTTDVLNVLGTSEDCEYTKKLSVLNADQNHSDLQMGVYEGGLKIWECTYDLIDFIVEHDLNLKNKKILDLGCGTGLVGLTCLVKGTTSCTFQDYNSEILNYITIPNVRLNDEDYLKKCEFYCGDWKSFADLLNTGNEKDKFDYIFTSETIYNTENYDKLHQTFQQLLKSYGEIFLAAKSYYFGVGGGISLFKEFLEMKNIFKSETSWKCPEGLKREILRITFL